MNDFFTFLIGVVLFFGFCKEINYDNAFKYYNLAIEKGSYDAINNLGFMY